MSLYCELCGRLVTDERMLKTVVVEGAVLHVCIYCYRRLAKQGKIMEEKPLARKYVSKSRVKSVQKTVGGRTMVRKSRIPYEEYEIVPDYAKRIREARMRMGWSTKVLADKVREKENVIKRIESGKLMPSIELARRLERILHIKLLEPVVEETTYTGSKGGEDYFTIGDLIRVSKKK